VLPARLVECAVLLSKVVFAIVSGASVVGEQAEGHSRKEKWFYRRLHWGRGALQQKIVALRLNRIKDAWRTTSADADTTPLMPESRILRWRRTHTALTPAAHVGGFAARRLILRGSMQPRADAKRFGLS
jgi:hypothetical protein